MELKPQTVKKFVNDWLFHSKKRKTYYWDGRSIADVVEMIIDWNTRAHPPVEEDNKKCRLCDSPATAASYLCGECLYNSKE